MDVLDFLQKRPLERMCARVLYQKGLCRPVAQAPGALLMRTEEPLYLLCADDEAAALAVMAGQTQVDLLVSDCPAADAALMAGLGLSLGSHCYTVAYEKTTPVPMETAVRFAPLTMDDFAVVHRHYKLVDAEGIKKHLREGALFGGYAGEELIGFIGIHEEKTMGMLHIMREQRKKGYGYVLEGSLMNRLLAAGEPIYAHIIEDNTASLALQRKLGMTRSEGLITWLYRKEEDTCRRTD